MVFANMFTHLDTFLTLKKSYVFNKPITENDYNIYIFLYCYVFSSYFNIFNTFQSNAKMLTLTLTNKLWTFKGFYKSTTATQNNAVQSDLKEI